MNIDLSFLGFTDFEDEMFETDCTVERTSIDEVLNTFKTEFEGARIEMMIGDLLETDVIFDHLGMGTLFESTKPVKQMKETKTLSETTPRQTANVLRTEVRKLIDHVMSLYNPLLRKHSFDTKLRKRFDKQDAEMIKSYREVTE